jgi:hypothetical protein
LPNFGEVSGESLMKRLYVELGCSGAPKQYIRRTMEKEHIASKSEDLLGDLKQGLSYIHKQEENPQFPRSGRVK